ncbi:MAG: relaxase [Pseudomonadota bacterium]
MILKGSQRGGAKQLGAHLLKTEENERVEVHEIRGFMADDVVGALREAEAISKGTKCRQFLFSVSLNPPERENVRVETFEGAIDKIEERNGLTGQPRVIVFHEKEGGRHAHAVWSRIDAETMTAKPLPYFKNKLRETSKELYLENGWQMPRGLMDSQARDPRNFTLAEWQQAKRVGRNAGELKALIQECWAVSDSRKSFAHALEERGLYLARGDRRGHVAVTFEGEPISIPRAIGQKSKDVQARLGKPAELPSITDTRQRIAETILPRMKEHLQSARNKADRQLVPLEQRRFAMAKHHDVERARMDAGQKQRQEQEALERANRQRKGVRGLWDRLTGKHAKAEKQNEMEALWALQRDREQRQALIDAQLRDRQSLQEKIRDARATHAKEIRALHFDLTNYRLMKRGQEPKARPSFERTKPAIQQQAKAPPTPVQEQRTSDPRLDRLRSQQRPAEAKDNHPSPEERLERLRERKQTPPTRGPEFER